MKTKLELLEQIHDEQAAFILGQEINIRLYTQDNIIVKDPKLSGQVELKIRQLKAGNERAERSLKIIKEMIEEEMKKQSKGGDC